MARQRGASCRLCRREKEKLFLKGARCSSGKCAFDRRESPPGQHGDMRKGKMSNYSLQLREKQKAKRIYGILERQFKNYFKKAEKSKGATGEVLLQLLERRLDNVIFRSCFAESRDSARQLVLHGFVKVNGRRVNIPSYIVGLDDEIKLEGKDAWKKRIKEVLKKLEARGVPDWIQGADEQLIVKIKRLPVKSDIGMAIEESLIVELYSK